MPILMPENNSLVKNPLILLDLMTYGINDFCERSKYEVKKWLILAT